MSHGVILSYPIIRKQVLLYNRFVFRPLTKLFAVAIVISILASIFQIIEAQKKLRQERQSILSIDFIRRPESAMANQAENFLYHVEAPPSFTTLSTTIYYSYDSTPSALTKFDSPDAVRYANHTNDYFVGPFKLPENFESNIKFSNPGTIYFRAYAKVGNDHLWTDEQNLTVK